MDTQPDMDTQPMPVDFYMHVSFANYWNNCFENNTPNDALINPLPAKEIPWEITICNAKNPSETIVFTPTSISLLKMGLIYLNDNYIFPPRYYPTRKCIDIEFNMLGELMEDLVQDLVPDDSDELKLLCSWELPKKTIGVLNKASFDFAEKYFCKVVLLKDDPTPISVPLLKQPKKKDYVQEILDMEEEDVKQMFQILKKKQRRRSARLQAKQSVNI